MNYIMILPVLISFAISAALGPVVIPLLRRLKFGQTVREEGPKSHLKKSGTPTMGGLIIPFVCKGLSGDYTYSLCDRRLWDYRISG